MFFCLNVNIKSSGKEKKNNKVFYFNFKIFVFFRFTKKHLKKGKEKGVTLLFKKNFKRNYNVLIKDIVQIVSILGVFFEAFF